MRAATVSVPGKLILMGEHAAVYGRPALVAALGLRTRVRMEPRAGSDLELDLAALDHRETVDWSRVLEVTRRQARSWERYAEAPTPASFRGLVDPDPARVVKLALGETASRLEMTSPPGLRVLVESELPVGSGFGSSAAVAVAVAGCLLEILGEGGDRERLAGIALAVERRQHGQPSGVDHTTVIRGGVLALRPGSGGELRLSPIPAAPSTLAALRLFDTGVPAEGTGEVVAEVRARREGDRPAFDAILGEMEAATARLEGVLRSAGGPEEIGPPVRSYQRLLERIGVVPAAVATAVRELEARGGAAKISGAGALSGPSAGALIVCGGGADGGSGSPVATYRPLAARIGAPGFRVEEGP